MRLLIIADDMLARIGLTTLLEAQEGLEVVGQVDSERPLVHHLQVYLPDVLLWDGGWGQYDAPTMAQMRDSDLPVLMLTAQTVPQADMIDFLMASSHGGRAILTRQNDAPTLLATLKAIEQGLITLDPRLARFLPQPLPASTHLHEALTPRETDVLHGLAQGLTNKAIAQTLHITEHTVKYHVNAIMGKLNAQSRTDAVIRATRAGLVKL